jgi:hypothetical protein
LEAELLERLDLVDEGLAATEIAIGLARHHQDPRTEYEMHFISVWMLERSGQWSRARRMLKRAHKLARENGLLEQALETALELFVSARRIRPYAKRRILRTGILFEADLKRWTNEHPLETQTLRSELRAKVDEVQREIALEARTEAGPPDRWLSEDDLEAAQAKLTQQVGDLADFERLVHARLGVPMRTFCELVGTVPLAAFEAIRYAEWKNCLAQLLNSDERAAAEKDKPPETIPAGHVASRSQDAEQK